MWPMKKKNKNNIQPVTVLSEEVARTVETAVIDFEAIKGIVEMTDEQQAEVNVTIHQLNQSEIERNMVKYLQSTGRFEVTPSGTPSGIIRKATDVMANVVEGTVETVENTAIDSFHVGRGVFRKIGQGIGNKLTELKELGS